MIWHYYTTVDVKKQAAKDDEKVKNEYFENFC